MTFPLTMHTHQQLTNTSSSQAKAEPNKKAKAEKSNTAIYVTSIPLDATLEEIHDEFKRYGIIAEEIDSNRPRIKMYTDEQGNFKGDALIVYFRPESVSIAIQQADGWDFQYGRKGPNGVMTVTVADASYKKTKQDGAGAGAGAGEGSGANTPQSAGPRRGRKGDKQKIMEKTERLNARLADWSDDEDGGALLNKEVKKEVAKKANRWDKIVVLKHMFDPATFAEECANDPEAKSELLEDVKEKCEEVSGGNVLDLFIWDLEPDGIISVRFGDAEAAAKCVQMLQSFKFDGRRVEASISIGQRFRKSKATDADEEEEKRRLEAFAEAIENAPE